MKTSLSFVGPAYFLDNSAIAHQESINYYLEFMGEEGRDKVALRGTPGLRLFSSGLKGKVRGLFVFNGNVYCLAGDTFYTIASDGTATSKGTITGLWRAYAAFNAANQIVIADAPVDYMDGYFLFPGTVSIGYIYDINAGTVTQISDTDFDTAGDRAFFISAINDGTSYDALDFASPESDPDNCVGVLSDHRQAVLPGDRTIEFWVNTGGLDFPFTRQTGAIIERGVIAPATFIQCDDSILFLGDDRVFYALKGFVATPISPVPVTEAIEGYGDISDAEAFYHTWRGHKFYTVSFPSVNETWVFDASLPPAIAWHKRRSWLKGRWRANTSCYAYGKTLVGDFEAGKIYYLDGNTFDENGEKLEAIRTGHYYDADDRYLTLSSFKLIMKAGVGILSGQGSKPKVELTCSRDDGQTFQNARWKDIGEQGAHMNKVLWRNVCHRKGGISIRTRITDPVNRDIVKAVGEMRVGT